MGLNRLKSESEVTNVKLEVARSKKDFSKFELIRAPMESRGLKINLRLPRSKPEATG